MMIGFRSDRPLKLPISYVYPSISLVSQRSAELRLSSTDSDGGSDVNSPDCNACTVISGGQAVPEKWRNEMYQGLIAYNYNRRFRFRFSKKKSGQDQCICGNRVFAFWWSHDIHP